MKKLFFLKISILLAVISQGILASEEGNKHCHLEDESKTSLGCLKDILRTSMSVQLMAKGCLCPFVHWVQYKINSFVEQLSDVLLRNKRVINPNPNAALARYTVSISRNREHLCGGAILSAKIVITAAYCSNYNDVYVLSGAKNLSTYAVTHHIIFKEIHPHYNEDTYANNLALLIVNPDIVLGTGRLVFNRPIQLYNTEMRSGFVGILSGWGSSTLQGHHITYSDILQSIHVQVLDWEDCARLYGNHYNQFTNLEFCTHDPQGHRRSGYFDTGSPLVVHGMLLGVLSWARMISNQPDVYTNLALPIYREWIAQFVRTHSH